LLHGNLTPGFYSFCNFQYSFEVVNFCAFCGKKDYQDRQLIEITKSEYRISGQAGNQKLKNLPGSPLNRDFRFAPTGLSGLA